MKHRTATSVAITDFFRGGLILIVFG